MEDKTKRIIYLVSILLILAIGMQTSYAVGFKQGYTKGAVDAAEYIYNAITTKPTIDYCDKPYYSKGNWYCEVTSNGR